MARGGLTPAVRFACSGGRNRTLTGLVQARRPAPRVPASRDGPWHRAPTTRSRHGRCPRERALPHDSRKVETTHLEEDSLMTSRTFPASVAVLVLSLALMGCARKAAVTPPPAHATAVPAP